MHFTRLSLLATRRAYERVYGTTLPWTDAEVRAVGRGAKKRLDLLPLLHSYQSKIPWQHTYFSSLYHVHNGKLFNENGQVRVKYVYYGDRAYRRTHVTHLLKHRAWPEGVTYDD